jgi:hypothetical protein
MSARRISNSSSGIGSAGLPQGQGHDRPLCEVLRRPPRISARARSSNEDWAWDHWPGFDAPDHPWARERRLTDLIIQLTEVAGAGSDLIARIEIYQGFVAIERGPRVLAPRQAFQLEDQIQTRGAVEVSTAPTFAPPSPLSRLKRWLRRKIG